MGRERSYLGAVEAGGTKMVCAAGYGPEDLSDEARFPTAAPEETLDQIASFFEGLAERPAAVGVGSFGPLDPDPDSPTYGHITETPKSGWSGTDFAGALRRRLGVSVVFDTDVNAAALGEHRWGAARGLDTFVYLTVGTGIGGGGMAGGRLLHGLSHPEMGHLFLPRADGDDFAGCCPFHGACLEGLASGPALEARWDVPGEELPDDHRAWEMEAHYLAHAVYAYLLVLSPQRVVLGGGVMKKSFLFPMIRERLEGILGGYLSGVEGLDDLEAFVVPPGLGDRAGVLGALALAESVAVR